MNPQYNRAAYRLSILEAVESFLKDRYLEEDSPVREDLICEHVFYKDRIVPDDAIMEFIYELQVQQGEQKNEMAQFTRAPERKGKKDEQRKPKGGSTGSEEVSGGSDGED